MDRRGHFDKLWAVSRYPGETFLECLFRGCVVFVGSDGQRVKGTVASESQLIYATKSSGLSGCPASIEEIAA